MLEKNLQTFCEVIGADEVVLFERSTFLVISHYDNVNHVDEHRFEKISNIIKQFKLSCIKTKYSFESMVVESGKFSAYVEAFTSSTYIMIIVSNPKIEKEAILMNIRSTQGHFETIMKNSYNVTKAD